MNDGLDKNEATKFVTELRGGGLFDYALFLTLCGNSALFLGKQGRKKNPRKAQQSSGLRVRDIFLWWPTKHSGLISKQSRRGRNVLPVQFVNVLSFFILSLKLAAHSSRYFGLFYCNAIVLSQSLSRKRKNDLYFSFIHKVYHFLKLPTILQVGNLRNDKPTSKPLSPIANYHF